MEIRDFSKDFLVDIMEIEKKSFKRPWTKEMFVGSADDENTKFKVCFKNGILAGFCIYRTILGETEILNIAVAPLFRKQSLAKNMLTYAFEDAKKDGSKNVFLEVGHNNFAAIKLYESFGFEKIGMRKKYYIDGDAVILRKSV